MSLEKTCWGCREDQPNQLAHMDLGGCLYSEFVSDSETTCDGCREHDPNELAHMEPGGCLHRPRYSVDEYDDNTVIDIPVKKSGEMITIQNVLYYYDKETNILYTDKTMRKAICKYNIITCMLTPL